jgi:heme O synthase-like polyprenyltransferase
MAGQIYLYGAVGLGLIFLYFGARMMFADLAVTDSRSRIHARQLFRCSIIYLPLLFALMMGNSYRG